MRAFLDRVLAWIRLSEPGHRRWIILSAAVALVVAGRWLDSLSGLTFAANIAKELVEELGRLQPLRIVPLYIAEVMDGPAGGALNPANYFGALFDTFGHVLQDQTGIAWLALLMSFVMGGLSTYILWSAYRGDVDDWTFFDAIALVVLIPVATTIAALLLQLVASLLLFIFGAVLGVVAFVTAYLGWLGGALAFIRDVRSKVGSIEAGADAADIFLKGNKTKSAPPPTTPPNADGV